MPAATVLGLATEGGARALGLDGVGRLEPAGRPTCQLVDAAFPTPAHRPQPARPAGAVAQRHHVRDVMVAGTWRVRGGEVLGADLDAMRARVHEQAHRLWARS